MCKVASSNHQIMDLSAVPTECSYKSPNIIKPAKAKKKELRAFEMVSWNPCAGKPFVPGRLFVVFTSWTQEKKKQLRDLTSSHVFMASGGSLACSHKKSIHPSRQMHAWYNNIYMGTRSIFSCTPKNLLTGIWKLFKKKNAQIRNSSYDPKVLPLNTWPPERSRALERSSSSTSRMDCGRSLVDVFFVGDNLFFNAKEGRWWWCGCDNSKNMPKYALTNSMLKDTH